MSPEFLAELDALARATRQVGEDSVTAAMNDGSLVTFIFEPKPKPALRGAGALMVDRLRRATLLFPGLKSR